ncbi:hypothetical protein V8E36_004897 [Tilletia maclaganii]
MATSILPLDRQLYELLWIKRDDELSDPAKQVWVYETITTGYTLFNRPAVFGGLSLGVAIQAAFESIFEELGAADASHFRAYSFQGSFLGSSLAQYPIRITVTTLRSTRSFITRIVTLSQHQNLENPQTPRRNTLVAICDFARHGRAPLIDFSAPALNPVTGQSWERPENLKDHQDTVARRIAEAEAKGDQVALKRSKQERSFHRRWNSLLEYRLPPDSLFAQNYWGNATEAPSTQDHLHPSKRIVADWFRVRPDFSPAGLAQISAKAPQGSIQFKPVQAPTALLSFILDHVVPLTPIMVNKIARKDAGWDFSLDFSIRFHRDDDLDLNRWHLRQYQGLTAAAGRSFSQVTVWDDQGRIVATMSQQGHLVPPTPPKAAAASKAAPKSKL